MKKTLNDVIKKHVLLSILSVIAVIMATVTISYALFQTEHVNTENQSISLGTLSIDLTSGTGPIVISDLYPADYSELAENENMYTFTISNTGTYAINYEIYLTDNTDVFLAANTSYSSYTKMNPESYKNIDYMIDKSGTSKNLNETYTSGTGRIVIMSGYLDPSSSENHSMQFWLDKSSTNDVIGNILSLNINMEASATTELPVYLGKDNTGANTPKLVDNLSPVVYDTETSEWVKVSEEQMGWYNYGKQIWANAVTVTSAVRDTYKNAPIGTTIPMADILGMYVWIPRYEYNFTNLGTSYAGGTAALPGAIGINFVSGTSITETTNYIIHPAFRNGSVTYTNNAYTTTSAYQMGGWDSELTGFWYGKFETGASTNLTTDATDTTNILIKPDVYSRRNQAVSNEYLTAKNIAADHGISLDSHMSKNSEWGAVTYLTQSNYGKYGNENYTGANKEIYINNSSSMYTGRSMGMPGGASGSSSSIEGSYTYNIELSGTGASTSGNIYGVYDMVGGAYEYVMGNYNNYSGYNSLSNSGFSGLNGNDGTTTTGLTFPNQKYYDKYTTNSATTACGGICYGHALSEIGGYYGDSQSMISSSFPWFLRGSYYNNFSRSNSGVFDCLNHKGNSGSSNGFRAVLS